MITREQLIEEWDSLENDRLPDVIDAIMELITDERNQYQELVEAAVMWHKFMDHNDRNHEMTSDIPKGLADAVKPFIKPSLSEKITSFSEVIRGETVDAAIVSRLRELAEEAKTLEQERELMKYR